MAPGVSTGRKTLCKSSDPMDHALGKKKRCRFVSGWCESSAAHRAAQRHWCGVATQLPALLVCLSACQSLLAAHGQPCCIQRLSASAVLAGGMLCFISGAAA